MAPALAAHRATDVLRHVARHHDEQPTLSALAAHLDVSPAAMHAVLTALTASGLLERDEATKTYRLGPEATIIGSAARAQDQALLAAAGAATRIVERHGLSVTVLALRGEELMVIDGFGPRLSWNSFSVPGRSVPFAPPFGTVFAATAPAQDVVAWLQRGGVDPASSTAERYRVELERVARRGWSVGMVPGGADDVETAWSELVEEVSRAGPASRARVAHAFIDAYTIDDYVIDNFDSDELITPTLINIGLETSDTGAKMALAVSGFSEAMPRRDVAELATRLCATAREPGVSTASR